MNAMNKEFQPLYMLLSISLILIAAFLLPHDWCVWIGMIGFFLMANNSGFVKERNGKDLIRVYALNWDEEK